MSAESDELEFFSRYVDPSGATRSITRSPRQVCTMSTVTARFDGALPVRPDTVTDDVTAAPLSGIDTSAVFSNDVPPPPPPPERAPTATAAHASCTALYSAPVVPYSSPAAASVPVRAAA